MANQPPHKRNVNLYHEVEKTSRDAINLAHKVVKKRKGTNPQMLSLEDPIAIVTDPADLACTLAELAEESGIVETTDNAFQHTAEMVARIMGKMAGGREQAMHRLLPQVKKEIKSEMRDSKALNIPRLDEKRANIAAGKRHKKAKRGAKGPKSAQGGDTNNSTDRTGEDALADLRNVPIANQIFETSESKGKRLSERSSPTLKRGRQR